MSNSSLRNESDPSENLRILVTEMTVRAWTDAKFAAGVKVDFSSALAHVARDLGLKPREFSNITFDLAESPIGDLPHSVEIRYAGGTEVGCPDPSSICETTDPNGSCYTVDPPTCQFTSGTQIVECCNIS